MPRVLEVFSKEAQEKRKAKLKEEIERGYFDDFKELRDTRGRLFAPPPGLLPAAGAQAFPHFEAQAPGGDAMQLPLTGPTRATLVSVAFRAGADDALASWTRPWRLEFAPHADVVKAVELSLVESIVMRAWPFRQIILRSQSSAASAPAASEVPTKYLFHFGDAEDIRQALGMTNRLTGYVYLVDGAGRVRWRASGPAQPGEVQGLLAASRQLLAER